MLDDALSLFLKGKSFVSALTLAGAAEEILGKALSHRGQQNSVELETRNPRTHTCNATYKRKKIHQEMKTAH